MSNCICGVKLPSDSRSPICASCFINDLDDTFEDSTGPCNSLHDVKDDLDDTFEDGPDRYENDFLHKDNYLHLDNDWY